ncbi:MAG: fructosamine kinase family protein [Phycisphaerales bacterium]|nr:fructosamine kinase family protein [Phycisphaerales bacterium]
MAETDISWQVLRRIVQQWAGTSAELVEVKSLVGGSINTTMSLTISSGERAVIKITPHRVNLHYPNEAHQLDLLRSLGIPTPRVLALNLASLEDPASYLLMEFVSGINLNQAKAVCTPQEFDGLQQQLAEMVLLMHDCSAELYGRVTAEAQELGSFASWPQFYREVYDQIWQEAWKRPNLSPKVRRQIAKVHGKLDQLLVHDDKPRLAHWDLWANNILCRCSQSGQWEIVGIIDPECKWAHTEAEIAYLELFKTVNPAFLKHYQQKYRLSDDYRRLRRPIYQMYELVNHLCLFGNEYLTPLEQAVEQAALVA